jgi:hypothetical protein
MATKTGALFVTDPKNLGKTILVKSFHDLGFKHQIVDCPIDLLTSQDQQHNEWQYKESIVVNKFSFSP